MFCNKCGAQLPDNATFCSKCGAPISNAFQTAQQPQTSQAKPKNNKPIIIGLSVAIVVLLIPLIILISKIASGDGSEAPTGSDHEHNTIATVADDVTEKESSTEGAVNGATSVQTTTPVTAPPTTQAQEKPSEAAPTIPAATSGTKKLIIAADYEDPDYYDSPYYDPEYGPAYGIVVENEDGNNITFGVFYLGRNASPFYETDLITVTLDENHSASFNWKDSWGNSGNGTITFGMTEYDRPCATLTMNQTQTSDSNRYSLATTNKKLYATESYAP